MPLAVVTVMIFNKKGEFLAVSSQKWSNRIVMPGGKIEFGESMLNAVKREAMEETNLHIKNIRLLNIMEFVRPAEYYKKAHFISFNFIADSPSTNVKLNYEGTGFRWVKPKDALKLRLSKPHREILKYYIWYKR